MEILQLLQLNWQDKRDGGPAIREEESSMGLAQLTEGD